MAMYIDPWSEMMMDGALVRAANKSKPATDPLRLKATLIQYGRNKGLLDRVTEVLFPLYKIADAKQFALNPVEMMQPEQLSRVITVLTGGPVLDVMPVSVSRPPVGLLASDENFQERLAERINEGSMMYSLNEILNMRFHAARFGHDFSRELRQVIKASLWDGLLSSIKSGTRPIEEKLGYGLVWPALFAGIYFFVCFAVLGGAADQEQMQRLEPLLKLTATKVLLLGERKGEGGHWVVLGD